jgi:hypothetical protein
MTRRRRLSVWWSSRRPKTLPPQKLRDIVGVGLVQPGKTRKFLLPVDPPANVTQITASIDYKPGK